MPSSKRIPIPPTAVTLSFGGVDFRLDSDSLTTSDDTQVSFQGKDDDNVIVNLTNFTGTMCVSMSSLPSTTHPQERPSRVSLDTMTMTRHDGTPDTTTAKVVEESVSPPANNNKTNEAASKRGAADISPRQQQLTFPKQNKSKLLAVKKGGKTTSSVTETPAAATSKTDVPDKPQKGERDQQKRTLVEIQTNAVPSPLTKKSRRDQDVSDDSALMSLMQNASQLSQPTQESNTNQNLELTQEDTVDGREDLFLPADSKSVLSSASDSDDNNDNILCSGEETSNQTDSVPRDVTVQSERRGQPPPSPRWGHSMTKLDGERLIVYGGQGYDSETGKPQVLSDIHVYDLRKHIWYQPVNCKGVPRQWHTATFLPSRQLLISFGGETKHPKTGRITTTDQVMVLDTEIMLWYPPSVSGTIPSGRSGHTATILSNASELVVFGGVKGSKWQNSVAVLDISRWRWSAPKVLGDAPRPRSYHSATAISGDDGVSRLVIFGGNDAVSSFNSVHVLETDGERWTWIHPNVGGTAPSARTGHCATLLGDNKTIMVYGGWDPNADDDQTVNDDDMIYADSYLLNTTTWQWRDGPKPAFAGDGESVENSQSENGGARRVGHTSVLTDSTETLVFGGRIPGDKFSCDFQTLALE